MLGGRGGLPRAAGPAIQRLEGRSCTGVCRERAQFVVQQTLGIAGAIDSHQRVGGVNSQVCERRPSGFLRCRQRLLERVDRIAVSSLVQRDAPLNERADRPLRIGSFGRFGLRQSDIKISFQQCYSRKKFVRFGLLYASVLGLSITHSACETVSSSRRARKFDAADPRWAATLSGSISSACR